MIIGVDYYPEHWDEDMWEKDIRLMAETGVSVVRIAEFAWCRIEPQEGCFDFEWLDRAVDLLEKYGLDIIMCTPTNCPPLWLYEKYPSAVIKDHSGRPIETGIRGHRCYNDPDFVRLSSRVVDVMTKRYGKRKSVKAWQIDNELESNICGCDTCTQRYRSWLKDRYGSLKELNNAYGNTVWSGEFSSWEQIKPPAEGYNRAWLNPGYMLDYLRFASDDMIEFVRTQAEIIRRNCPETVITTNSWFCEKMPDLHETFKELDFVSYDNYPPLRLPDNGEEYYSHSFHLDFMRGISNKNFCIMEQLSGAMGCWMPMTHTVYPGMIKGYSLQAFAHGADAVLHFRWRTACKGAEMHWHGLIDHSNVPGRRFYEFADLCKEARSLERIRGTGIRSDVAVLYSYDSDMALRLQPQTDGFYYYDQLKAYHGGFSSCGVNVDIISAECDLSKYKIVCAPALYVCPENLRRRLEEYVEQGGTLIITCRSLVKDENNNCIMSQLPAGFDGISGCCVSEYDPVGYDRMTVKDNDGNVYQCTCWCDILSCTGAEPILTYRDGFYKNSAAASVNCFGKGNCYYIGTVLFRDFYRRLAQKILSDRKIEFFPQLPGSVEITVRENEYSTYYFCFNNSYKQVKFDFKGECLELAPFEMKVREVTKNQL